MKNRILFLILYALFIALALPLHAAGTLGDMALQNKAAVDARRLQQQYYRAGQEEVRPPVSGLRCTCRPWHAPDGASVRDPGRSPCGGGEWPSWWCPARTRLADFPALDPPS